MDGLTLVFLLGEPGYEERENINHGLGGGCQIRIYKNRGKPKHQPSY